MLAQSNLSTNALLSGTVLVVDHDRFVREAIEELLILSGLEVLSTSDGREAIDLFQAHHCQIKAVILSVRLQGMCSEEVLDQIQAIDGRVKVIISSSYAPYEVAQRFTGRHWSGYLQKPYGFEELLDSLRAVWV